MANEILTRTPTSTGNRRVWTWAGWVKLSGADHSVLFSVNGSDDTDRLVLGYYNNYFYVWGSSVNFIQSTRKVRDFGNWHHVLVHLDTTQPQSGQRLSLYINGVIEENLALDNRSSFTQNEFRGLNRIATHAIGMDYGAGSYHAKGSLTDIFLVDGQALTPDVFGFYKDGDGYISAGSTQATDFRPGQWVPHSPRKIKSDIERRGGFGANGYYLPMNSSNNPGADFHCTPNTILKLKEDLPQPKAEIDGVGDYTGALRDDPFKQYLVLAVPGVIDGKQNGYGDYSADIKGSGTNKTLTTNGNAAVASVSSHYGSAMTFDGSGDYFTLTSSADFNFGTGDYTIELWAYHTALGAQQTLIGDTYGSTNGAYFYITSLNQLAMYYNTNSGTIANGPENGVKQDQWSHYAAVRKSGVLTLFMNGVVVDSVADAYNLNVTQYYIGDTAGTSSGTMSGNMQDIRVYKGVAKYTSGFDVPKPYTPVGIESWRTTADTCSNNFATWNVLTNHHTDPLTMSNGNLTMNNYNVWRSVLGTHGVSSGKWYYEMKTVNDGSYLYIGWGNSNANIAQYPSEDNNAWAMRIDEPKAYHDQTGDNIQVSFSGAFTQNDICGCAFDADNGRIWWSKNGTWLQGDPATGASPVYDSEIPTGVIYHPMAGVYTETAHTNFGQNPSFSGQVTAGTNTDDSGKGLFKYAPPSGYLALCEDNLPTPAIADPGKHFKTVLYTGKGSTGVDGAQSIRKVGFQPDLVWVKKRGTAGDHKLIDSVRGSGLVLESNTTDQEGNETNNFAGFNFDGFDLGVNNAGAWNESPYGYVAWCWKAGGAAVSNNDGSITSQVSVNQEAGFSIVSYDGTGSNSNTGHGLSKTPDFIIWKAREDAYNWDIYHSSLGYQASLIFTTAGTRNALHAAPTSTTIPVTHTYTGGSASGKGMIAYCWTEIEGYSKFGSYVGNSSNDGTFVYCGFKPAWVMIKVITTGTTNSWYIHDSSRNSTNPSLEYLMANNPTGGTSATSPLDMLSNGFKLRNGSYDGYNGNYTYIFMAFAESPFQTANAK